MAGLHLLSDHPFGQALEGFYRSEGTRKRNIRGPLTTVSHNIGWTIEGWQAKRAEENKDQWHGKPQRKPSKKKDKSLDGRNAKYPWRTYQGRPQGRRTEKKAKWSKVDPSAGGCRGGRSLTEIKLTPSFWEIPHRWNRFQNTVFCVISEMYNPKQQSVMIRSLLE